MDANERAAKGSRELLERVVDRSPPTAEDVKRYEAAALRAAEARVVEAAKDDVEERRQFGWLIVSQTRARLDEAVAALLTLEAKEK